jgi:hypothetical protein
VDSDDRNGNQIGKTDIDRRRRTAFAGPRGVIALLQKRDYKIEQL